MNKAVHLEKASSDVKITVFCNLRHIPKDIRRSLPEATGWEYEPRNTTLQFLDSSNRTYGNVGIVTGYELDDCGVRVRVPIWLNSLLHVT
jgi:hypothetical protein